MCNNCIHKPVCSKYMACGDVNSCEHYKEERKGRLIEKYIKHSEYHYCFCSECETMCSPYWIVCPVCGADMKGD